MPSRSADPGQELQGHPDISESNPVLQKLQDASFDPVDFLNSSTLPLSSLAGPQHSSKSSKVTQIQDTSTQVQALLTKLNAQNLRYSNTLTQLTDEILRTGSRLAYEVEVLRGDANGLYEVLTDTLQDDINKLNFRTTTVKPEKLTREGGEGTMLTQSIENGSTSARLATHEPDFIPQLRMLGQVKARLEEVINIFGEAMEWPLAPSELSIASSLISVSAPDPDFDIHLREEKAREATTKLRSEINNLLDGGIGGYAGLEAAASRVDSLRSLANLWKGTAEERARTKFVDSLARVVDERRKALDASQDSGRQGIGGASQWSSSMPARPAVNQAQPVRNENDASNQSGGLLRNLQRLRDDFYLD